MINELFRSRTLESIQVKQALINDPACALAMDTMAKICLDAIKSQKKILFCGNGGSAADAQHLSCELMGRFYLERAPIHSEALHVNTSLITAVSNDYSFEDIFSRQVAAKGCTGDVLIAISTSGNSPNVLKAVEMANKLDMHTIGWTGNEPSALLEKAKLCITVPSDDTPRIQECHILIGHILCEYLEKSLF